MGRPTRQVHDSGLLSRHDPPPEVPGAVQVVRGARPLRRHHRGTERIPRSAFLPEGTALVWLDQTLQHFSGTADARLVSMDIGHRKTLFGIKIRILRCQLPTAVRDRSDAAPRPVRHGEHILEHRFRCGVALRGDGTGVSIFDLVSTRFQLQHRLSDALQQIQRLESGDDDRDLVLLGQRRVLRRSHHTAHMPGRQKCLHAALWRIHDRGHRRRDQNVRDE